MALTTDAQELSLAPATVHIVDLVVGDTPAFLVTLVDNDTDTAINITGTTGAMTIRNQSGTPVISLTSGSGISITDAAGGEFTVSLTSIQTLLLNPQLVYKYDFQWTNGANVHTIVKGNLRASAQQTT